MKVFIEGVLPTGEKKIGWLKIANGVPFVCMYDRAAGEINYAITEVSQWVGIRGMKEIFIGAEVEK